MDAAQIAQLVTAAVAAAMQDQAVLTAIRGQGQPARPVAPFAVTPAGTGNNAWDFTSGTGLKIFIAATAPFTPQYDGTEIKLRDFLRKIWHRAEAFGWTTILLITDEEGTPRNITQEYGCLTVAGVKNHAITYLRQDNREHQASACLRQLIIGSITSKLADKLINRKANYTVNAAAATQPGQAAPPPINKEDGACMLYDIIKIVSVETKATVALIMKRLANLEIIMEECKSDIAAFNDRVDDLVNQLTARNVAVPSMLNPLFDGYNNCADKTFATYIARKQEAYEDGTIDLEYATLMSTALEKYKVLKDRKVWLKKTDEELEILTLKAEMSRLKTPSTTKGAPKGATDGKKSEKASDYAEKNAWKLVPPKQGETQHKTVNGKKYIYCPYHHTTKWVLEVNNKGIVHKTGCEKMKEALAAAKDKPKEEDASAAALANAIEDVGTDTLLPVVDEEL
ncbi:unknown protein [Seminavis robusta]|uniref:Uncharacterized protein n=1 Tax=Seminavis robusta TaxID=568900 RepID=A0A9N8DML1_9STRA|nr:unknown protein [Seminavis robusta]|eukprot:Sro243_g096990.1 n/a (454) ;mRNA; r:69383-70744